MNNPIDYIKKWRESFGLPVRTEPQVPSESELTLGLSLINEEFAELKEALMILPSKGILGENTYKSDAISLNEVADAIGDLYFVVSQMAFIFGFKPEDLIKTVYESNLSKVCKDNHAVDKAIAIYKQKGIELTVHRIPEGFIIKNKDTGKVLKGPDFFEPKWTYDEERGTK